MPCELAGAEMDERGGASRLVTVEQQPFVEVVRRRFRVLLPWYPCSVKADEVGEA